MTPCGCHTRPSHPPFTPALHTRPSHPPFVLYLTGSFFLGSQLAREGTLVFKREWTSFGSTNSVRDAILSSPPAQGFRWSKSLAPPSETAVDRMLEDLVAAARATAAARASAAADKAQGDKARQVEMDKVGEMRRNLQKRTHSPVSPVAVTDPATLWGC